MHEISIFDKIKISDKTAQTPINHIILPKINLFTMRFFLAVQKWWKAPTQTRHSCRARKISGSRTNSSWAIDKLFQQKHTTLLDKTAEKTQAAKFTQVQDFLKSSCSSQTDDQKKKEKKCSQMEV